MFIYIYKYKEVICIKLNKHESFTKLLIILKLQTHQPK
jgi:hypothetical protein